MGWIAARNTESFGCRLFFCDYKSRGDISTEDAGSKSDDGRTKTIIARTEWGEMMDFLKANPHVTREDYMWKWTIPQIRLAGMDYTHIVYLDEEAAKMANAITIDDADDVLNIQNLGIPIIGDKQ